MTYLVTGASGFIGGALARRLLAAGARVYGVGRDKVKLDGLREYGDFVPVVADFSEYESLLERMGNEKFDMIFHTAWQGTDASVYEDYEVQVANLGVARAIVCLAGELGCGRIVVTGSYYSRAVVDGADCVINPSVYGLMKQCASELCKTLAYIAGISCINAIIPNPFGCGEKKEKAMTKFIRALRNNESLALIEGNYLDDSVYITDVVDGLIAAAGSSRMYADYYIGHRRLGTFREKLLDMKRVLGSESELRFGVYPESSHIDYKGFDLDALYRDTGFECKADFGESILRVAGG